MLTTHFEWAALADHEWEYSAIRTGNNLIIILFER